MTLITNEIHLVKGIKKTFIISTADRRLTYDEPVAKKEKYDSGQKLFKIEHLNATVSYWGNFWLGNANKYYWDWLPDFISKSHDIKTLKDFALHLRENINQALRAEDLRKRASGFHFAGFSKDGVPEFLHFSNCKWNGKHYEKFEYVYRKPFEDFLQRDAVIIGGTTLGEFAETIKQRVLYRNGDLKVHAAAWDKVDTILRELFMDEGFKKISTLQKEKDDLKRYIEFKLKFIGDIYSKFAHQKGVGSPFDIEILTPTPGMLIDDFSTIFRDPLMG
jgi:hypothetical protein